MHHRPHSRCPRIKGIKGHSCPQEWYEDAVGELLGKVGELDDAAMAEIVRLYGEDEGDPTS